MPAETWEIVYREEGVSGDTGAPATGGASKTQEETADVMKKSAPHWAAVGKFSAGLLGTVGVIAFVFQMIRRSKVFSTFMDSFLMILSSVVDILMIPLIPLLAPVLKLFLKLIPLAMELSKKVEEFIKDPFKAIRDIFSGIGKAIEGIFNWFSGLIGADTLLGRVLGNVGEKIGGLFTEIGNIWASAGEEIQRIWTDGSGTMWDDIVATANVVWEALGKSGAAVWETIKKIWLEDIAPAIKAVWEANILPFIKEQWSTFMALILGTWNNTILPWWNDTFYPMLVSFAGEVWENIKEKFDEIVISPLGQQIQKIMGYVAAIGVGALAGGAVGGLPGMIIGGGIGFGVHKLFEMLGLEGKLGGGHIYETGVYKLHRGEEVVPAGQVRNQYSKPINIQNVYNISGMREDILADLKASMEDSMKLNEMRGYI